MAIDRQAHHLVITLDWDESTKRWKMVWKVRRGRGWAHHWVWIDTRVPIDAAGAADLASAVRAQLEARLW